MSQAAAGTAEVRHPIVARLFDRLSRLMEKEVGEHPDELLAGLSGRVVDVGAGKRDHSFWRHTERGRFASQRSEMRAIHLRVEDDLHHEEG